MGALQTKTPEAIAEEIIEVVKGSLVEDYPNPKDTLREIHPKTVALLAGTFKVRDDLPAEHRVGVFAQPGKAYPCWVRFSNASPQVVSDLEPDNRGCAIKLMTPEKPLVPINQDFVFLNVQTVAMGTAEAFRDFIYYLRVSGLALGAYFLITFKLHRLTGFLKGRTVSESIRGERFHSTTPYAFGSDRIVKYGLFPVGYDQPSITERVSANYLSLELQQHLNTREVVYDFFVQFQTDKEKMPLEDAAILWDEALSPFQKVATLTIPPQNFMNPQRAEMGESLRFNNGHTWEEHHMVGRLNIVRALVYTGECLIRVES
jgi:catalase